MFKKHSLFNLIEINLRGAGQVLFQENSLTGLVFIIGIFWSSFISSTSQVGIGTVVGLVIATSTALFLKYDPDSINKGLYGFNGVLVGISVPTFLINDKLMWAFIILGAVLSTILMNFMKKFNLTPLTFPFVLITWLILFIANPLNLLTSKFPETSYDSLIFYFDGTLKGLSQVFLINNSITGVIFLLGLTLSSIRAALWSIIGSLTGLFVALFMGVDNNSIILVFYGYSSAITAIALGSVFLKPSFINSFYTLLGIVITAYFQILLNIIIFSHLNLPSLTAPFVFVTWLFIYIHQSVEKKNFSSPPLAKAKQDC